mmetsp:Transcript_3417/g.9820  ORF Transcript_3417/g.9820 Transcript_3417/m.9820 type:complete len:533 (-) Transcript_3417:2061-3659(-)
MMQYQTVPPEVQRTCTIRCTFAAQRVFTAFQRCASTSSDDLHGTTGDLDSFLSWVVANGVKGVGTAVGIFEGEGGERGLVALKSAATGAELLRIPLRIALTDHPEDKESNALLYTGAPWSIRLAAKILREKAKGPESVYQCYLNVLPKSVPSPLTGFTWEEMQELQYQAVLTDVYETDWLAADGYSRSSPEAIGGASEEEFRWALSVVHSRTFGSASPQGGVGVRMMVPLVDMINHAGDWGGVVNGAASKSVSPLDVVVWELVPPSSDSGEWEMAVKAIRPIEEGQEIVMSYGERDNNDFLVHYGFVPEANPHDSVQLFSDGSREAAEWFLQQVYWTGDFSLSGIPDVESLLGDAVAAADEVPVDEHAQGDSLCVLHDGRVDARILRVFERLARNTGLAAAVGETADRMAARVVACRCAELLMEMKTHLSYDLGVLASWSEEGACNTDLFHFLQTQHTSRLKKLEAAGELSAIKAFANGRQDTKGADVDSSAEMSLSHLLGLQFRCYKKLLLWDTITKLGPVLNLSGLVKPY